jgi:hypothetical protein
VTSSGTKRIDPKPLRVSNLQASSHSPEPTGTAQTPRKRGRPAIDYPALQSPTIKDIVYAASFYEGEGHYNSKLGMIINQNDREKLDWLQIRFGGKIRGPYTTTAGNDYYSWILVRERALGFMFTIFTFLSKSRREQFKTGKRNYQQTISDSGVSEAFVKRNINKSIKHNHRVKGSMKLFGVRK